jgi:hypothetical protein
MKPTHKKCIEMIETVSLLYKVKFDIKYSHRQYFYNSDETGWTIKAMDKKFTDKDFTVAAFKAIEFVHLAHEVNTSK